MASYDEILSNKSSLEFEINTYRRLLESEEAHVKKSNEVSSHSRREKTSTTSTTFIRQSDHSTISPPQRPVPIISETKINQTEMQAKTTFQRSAKGFKSFLSFLFDK